VFSKEWTHRNFERWIV